MRTKVVNILSDIPEADVETAMVQSGRLKGQACADFSL